MFARGTAALEGELVCTPRKGGKAMCSHVKDGYGQKHSDLLALIMLAAMVSVRESFTSVKESTRPRKRG
jgi:hypothetical protein